MSMRLPIVLIAIASLVLAACGKQSPKRDQIPLLKSRLYELQVAVKERNTAAIDSLLSVSIISKKQSSDSLLSLVYGPDRDFAFERFGNYNILYTSDKARIECCVMDSTSSTDRPVVFFLADEHDLWLFTSFEVGAGEPDTLQADTTD